VPKDFRRGYIESFNVAVQREFLKQMTATVSYVGTHAIRQQTLYDVNGAPAGGGNAGRFLNTQYGANNSNSEIYSILPFQGSLYNGLQTQLTSTGSRLAQYGVVYTYSKTQDAADNGQLGTLMFVDPNQIRRNYGLAGYDRKDNFQFWSILKSPVDKGKQVFGSRALGLVAGGWQLTDILSDVSGTPFNVTASGTSLNAPGNTQVADYVTGNAKVLRSNTNGARQYLNPAAYAAVTTARFGTSGRNGVRGPGLFNLDTSLARSFPLFRESELQFQADVFNITNTPQFANPTANASTITTSGTGAIAPNGFGVITTSNSNRTMRLSARITF
jgi:hypothetical protein